MIHNYLIDIFNTNVNIMFKIGSKITAFYKNVIEQISSRDSNYVIDMVIWAKFVNSRIPNREVEILL